jgi:probable rRNA maturation factor
MDEDDLPYCIETHCDVALPGADDEQIRRVVRAVLKAEGCAGAEISVALLGEAAVRELNSQYLHRPDETDVLAFDLADEDVSEADGRDADRRAPLLGQVVVNVDLARRRAAERRVDPAGELMLYVVHGCLHLLGHDDAEPARADAMHRREDELLEQLGYGRVFAEKAEPARNEGPLPPVAPDPADEGVRPNGTEP